ncbi:hypothetical protein GT204_02260 [Streptomyces sp. SID4919]|uniref:hypothetical protein n=1 Tax=Streptomyces TaxID=1883 RepID=UPI000823DDA6|nr:MULTISPECIES: hypothetical protein [unclassified Streptomyces]MYY07748.1 hypothetical protein [Streptomyces sp. SID4919]SCK05263.1 hypothetical protein YW7DRAFT_00044 [Streptomyces sp. AmelKG-E11A]
MRTTQIAVRAGLAVAAAAIPLATASPVFAGGTGVPGITVTSSGSTVQVSTGACAGGGTASLMTGTQADFSQGRQATLSTGATQSATWTNVGSGTYSVSVVCGNGSTAGTRSVTVNAAPTLSSTTAPAGVRGGLGGSATDHRTLTLVGGGGLVLTGVVATVLYLRRKGGARQH